MNLGITPAQSPAGGWVICVSFDPGESTGWAVHRISLDRLRQTGFRQALEDRYADWNSGTIHGPSDLANVDGMMEVMRSAFLLGDNYDEDGGDLLVVVIEDFILQMLQMDRSLLSPVRISARFEDRLRDTRLPWIKQSASDAKRVITDARLRDWGLLRGGHAERHARDAQRHGILALRKISSSAVGSGWLRARQPIPEEDDE